MRIIGNRRLADIGMRGPTQAEIDASVDSTPTTCEIGHQACGRSSWGQFGTETLNASGLDAEQVRARTNLKGRLARTGLSCESIDHV